MGNVLLEDKGYTEILLNNNTHRLLGTLLKTNVLSKQPIGSDEEDVGYSIMWVLEIMVEMESPQLYREQYLEIFRIVMEVVKYDLLHAISL